MVVDRLHIGYSASFCEVLGVHGLGLQEHALSLVVAWMAYWVRLIVAAFLAGFVEFIPTYIPLILGCWNGSTYYWSQSILRGLGRQYLSFLLQAFHLLLPTV